MPREPKAARVHSKVVRMEFKIITTARFNFLPKARAANRFKLPIREKEKASML